MLNEQPFRERIYDGDSVRDYLIRYGEFDGATSPSPRFNAYQSVFSANALRAYFTKTTNSDWLLRVYLPSLDPAKRQPAITAICCSVRLVCRAANDADATFYRQWIERLDQVGQPDLAKTLEQHASMRYDSPQAVSPLPD